MIFQNLINDKVWVDFWNIHPLVLMELMEIVWSYRSLNSAPSYEYPRKVIIELQPVKNAASRLNYMFNNYQAVNWGHLIYAYMIENTGIYEIFEKVLFEYLHGGRLGTPSKETLLWLRTTEAVFYSDITPYSVLSISSYIRPDIRATRRNAYYRMFGMDLNHGKDIKDLKNRAYPYVKSTAANKEFVDYFQKLLVQIWIGIMYFNASSSANPTDTAAIANLAKQLEQMLTKRRNAVNLYREEFSAVAAMSWLHFAVEHEDSPILKSLDATSTSAANRLTKIAERLALPVPAKLDSFFTIAEPISMLLREIEEGKYSASDAIEKLLIKADAKINEEQKDFRKNMTTIITHWSLATGYDIKAEAKKITS